jgi:type IV secretion system protein VirD4
MNATKILWGQVLLVAAVVLGFAWVTMEWTAWNLSFQSQLGHHWFGVLGWPVFQPPAFFWWWVTCDAYARPIFVDGAYIASPGGIAAIVVAVAMSVWRPREIRRVTTCSSAHWEETRGVREAGLLDHDGFCSAAGNTAICATMAPNTSYALLQPGPAKGGGLGRADIADLAWQSPMTARKRIGR